MLSIIVEDELPSGTLCCGLIYCMCLNLYNDGQKATHTHTDTVAGDLVILSNDHLNNEPINKKALYSINTQAELIV